MTDEIVWNKIKLNISNCYNIAAKTQLKVRAWRGGGGSMDVRDGSARKNMFSLFSSSVLAYKNRAKFHTPCTSKEMLVLELDS